MWRKSAKLWLERGATGGQSRAPASPFRVEWCGWELGQESRERVRWTSKSRRSACLWKTARLGWSLSGISFCARCTRSGQSGDRRWGSERGGTVEFGRRNEASVLGSGANFQRICSRNAWEDFMGLQKTWRVACLCQAVFFERVTSWKRPRWRSHKMRAMSIGAFTRRCAGDPRDIAARRGGAGCSTTWSRSPEERGNTPAECWWGSVCAKDGEGN